MDEAEELRSTIYVYYDGAVKQDVARPVTEVNIVKPVNEKAMLSEIEWSRILLNGLPSQAKRILELHCHITS